MKVLLMQPESVNFYINGFIQYLRELSNELNLTGLKNFGVERKDIGTICLRTELKNNPVALTQENLQEIFVSVI